MAKTESDTGPAATDAAERAPAAERDQGAAVGPATATLNALGGEVHANSGGPGLSKFRKHPLVPVGAGVTALVLAGGLFAFQRGNTVWSQRMMRARVVAQGATLVILTASVGGLFSTPSRQTSTGGAGTQDER